MNCTACLVSPERNPGTRQKLCRTRSTSNSQLSIANCASAMSALAHAMLPRTGPASGPASSAPHRAGPLEMQTRQECPSRRTSPLECTDARHRGAPASESTFTNSLDLKSPGIRASWPFGGAEVLCRSAKAVTCLDCTLTKNDLLSSLECTDTNSLGLKPFRFHCYKKRGGCLSCPPNHQLAAANASCGWQGI